MLSKRAAVLLILLFLAGSWLAASPVSAKTAVDGDDRLPITFGGPFQLTDHFGKPRNDRDFRGRFMLVFFGYTFCPGICPTNLAVMAGVLDDLGEKARRLQPLFVTLDPARDKPEILRSYLRKFHPTMLGLTGDLASIKKVLKAYRVHRFVFKTTAGGRVETLVNHSANSYLMGPDGEFLTLIPHGSDARFLRRVLTKYLTRTRQ